VTRDKTLTMVGGAIGAIGAIGGLASASGLFGAASSSSSLFGAGAAASTADTAAASGGSVLGEGLTSAGADAASAAGVSGGDVLGSALTSGGADAASAGMIDSVGSQLGQAPSGPVSDFAVGSQDVTPAANTQVAQPLTASGTPATGPGTSGLMNTSSTAVTSPLPPPASVSPSNVPGNASGGSVLGEGLTSSGADAAGAVTPDSSGGLLSSMKGILDFANKYPGLTMGAVQAGGSLLSGLTSTLTPAQVAAYNAQANANNAAAALTQQQTANLAMPKAVASSTPVTGTPGQLAPMQSVPAPGMINSAPKLPPVTGAPA
jgi:hypothetical protein